MNAKFIHKTASVVAMLILVATSYVGAPNSASAVNVPEPDTCNEEYTYTFSSGGQNNGDDSSKPGNIDFINTTGQAPSNIGNPDTVTVTADAGFAITKVELSVDDDGNPGFATAANGPVTNYNPNPGTTINVAKVTVKKVCPDACTNIGGFQEVVPVGYETLSPGICTLIPIDACPLDAGFQATGPCQSDDVCPNDPGIQTNVNQCTPDACTNAGFEGFQATIPAGYEALTQGMCTPIPVDVCPRPGVQTSLTECQTLTLLKTVVNDNGGTALDTAWTLTASGPTPISGVEGAPAITNAPVNPGSYALSESGGPEGYEASTWSCNGGSVSLINTVTVSENDVVTCTIQNNDIPPQPTSATVNTAKVVCDAEQYLPNWGEGDADITSSTAANYVAASDGNCELVSGWEFQWAPNGTANPGDNVEEAGGAWTTFTSSVQLLNPNGALFWFREVIPSNYLAFSADVSAPFDDVSAEFYCSTDVLNYDNYDFISGVDAGETHYCAGFNVLENPPLPQCSDGFDNDEDGFIDFGGENPDPGCDSPEDNLELTCAEGSHIEGNQCVPNESSGTGTLVIRKQLLNVSEGIFNFDFDINSISQSYDLDVTVNGTEDEESIVVAAGTYDVIENVPENWVLSDYVTCEYDEESVGSSIQNGKSVTIAKNETVTCTFVNRFVEPPTDVCSNLEGTQTEVPDGTHADALGNCVTNRSSGNHRGGGGGGQVLGASTCGPLLSEYLHIGWANDSSEVTKLQEFLNEHLGLALPVSGVFGQDTFGAVEQFQTKYGDDVLSPWVGLPGSGITSDNTPTGYVYQTTRWQINNLWCPGSEAFPDTLI